MNNSLSSHPEISTLSTRFDFARYRDDCDSKTVGYRKTGLLNQELALMAMTDSRTITVEQGGLTIPILVPIEYEPSFDDVRCKELSGGGGDCYYLALTSKTFNHSDTEVKDLSSKITRALKSGDSIYFNYSEYNDDLPVLVAKILYPISDQLQEIDLKDKHAAENNQQASMALYSYLFNRIDKNNDQAEIGKGIYDLYKDFDFVYPDNGVGVYKGNSLTEDLKNQLWELFKDRFNQLGEKHPVSMEDTRVMFDEFIATKGTLFSIYFESNEPKALGFFLTSIEGCSWLNQSFLEDLQNNVDDREMLFFAGIVAARNSSSGSLFKKIVEKLTEDISLLEKDMWLLFEPSNRSEEYIPKNTRRFIEKTGLFECESFSVVDRQVYEGLRVR